MARTHRSGFTLFGLLVILAILGILLGLLLPAIQKVREAANRMKDANNLKQVGLAFHNYAATYNHFPPGYGGEPTVKGNFIQGDRGSWCYLLLPYLEQDNLYKAIGQGNAPATAVPTYYSPLRRASAIYNGKAKIDYAGNAGTGDDPEKCDPDDGIFSKNKLSFQDVQDGTSNTLMFGMKGLRTTEYLSGKGKGDSGSIWNGGTIDTLRTSNADKRLPLRDVNNEDHERGFGGPGASGINFAFCDGSVREIRYRIKAEVFQALITRNGGEVVPNDF
jgi:prepilin-type processing-associated H-X9-DG protein